MARKGRRILLGAAGVLVLATGLGVLSLRVGRSWSGTPEDVVLALLEDVRADIRDEDRASLGTYGVSTFLSWKNAEELRAYVARELAHERIGVVDYFVRGDVAGITRGGDGIRFLLVDRGTNTSCTVVLGHRLGAWFVRDVHAVGVPSPDLPDQPAGGT